MKTPSQTKKIIASAILGIGIAGSGTASFAQTSSLSPVVSVQIQSDTCSGGPGGRNDSFDLLSGGSKATHAIILIGGIHNTYHYFDAWVPKLSSPYNAVIGWNHDHQSMSMTAASKELACKISDLKYQGYKSVSIIAHSMGGLVAKGAIDNLTLSGKAGDFTRLDLWTLGTPWGGFALADLTLIAPGSEAISQSIGYPMGPDIGPSSSFMQRLAQPMPKNGSLRIYIGSKDDVAKPEIFTTINRYKSISQLAESTTVVKDAAHDDYNLSAPEDLIRMASNPNQVDTQQASSSETSQPSALSAQLLQKAANSSMADDMPSMANTPNSPVASTGRAVN